MLGKIISAALLLVCMRTASAEQLTAQPHYFHLRQGATFYVPNPQGKPFKFQVDLKDINTFCQGAQTTLLKAYDPDGNILFHEDVPDDGITSGGYQQAWAGWDHELWARGAMREIGAEPLFRWDAFSEPAKLDKIQGSVRTIDVKGGKPGTYQIQIAGCDDHFVKVSTTPGLKFGVLGHPDFIAGHGDQFRETYLYVPELPFYLRGRGLVDLWVIEHAYPRTRSLTLYKDDKPLPVTDVVTKTQTTRMTPGQALGRYQLSLEGIGPGTILKLVNEGQGDFLIRIAGLPPILCPDAETARLIAGDLKRAPDGPITSFAFQREMWEAIKHLKKEDFVVQPGPGQWFSASGEELAKIGVHSWSRSNTPAGAEGAIAKVNAAIAGTQPFQLNAFFESLNLGGGEIDDLTMFYLYPFQGNKLYHNAAVKNIITLGMVKNWMVFRCGEVIYEPGELNVAYAQGFHWDNWESIWNMKEQLDPAVLKAFQKGAAQIAERMHYANGLELVLSNGRTTVPLNLYHAYLITDDERLKVLSKRYFNRMMTALDGPHSGWSDTGYFREHFGPDGGYCTYPLFQIGRLYQLSKDPDVLDAMDRLCRWMCYTTLPAGGRFIGPTSWNSRIAMSAIEHIWGSGYKFVAQKSPWAAMIYRRMNPGPYDLADPIFEKAAVPNKPTLLLTHLTRGILPDRPLPADLTDPVLEDVGGGGELFAIRRGSYYALVFAGSRPPSWMDDSLGGKMCFNGGGLTGLYLRGPNGSAGGPVIVGRTPKEYGYPIEKWREIAVPVVAGQLSDGRFFNTGVSRNQVAVDKDRWTIATTGEAISAPVNYRRSYAFGEQAIDAVVAVRNADMHRDVFQYRYHFRKPFQSIRFAWELIPVWMEKETKITCHDASGKVIGELTPAPLEGVQSISVGSQARSIQIKLDQPRTVQLSEGAGTSRSVQVLVARDVQPEAEAELKYQIIPVAAK